MATQEVVQTSNLPAVSESAQRFELQQRQAGTFAASALVPDHLRKGDRNTALANCYIALTMAEAMGELPIIVMQNIHIVNGKAGFSSQYMIARANSSGVFKGRIDWRIDRSDKNNLKVEAFAVLADTGQEVSVPVDMAMAQAEGWTKNPKYKSMPEIMLRYRSAAFLVRFYAPDVMLGYQTSEEIEDVKIAHGPDLTATPLTGAMLVDQAREKDVEDATIEEVDAETGEVVEQENLASGDDAGIEDNPFAGGAEPAEQEPMPEAAQQTAEAIDGPLEQDDQPAWVSMVERAKANIAKAASKAELTKLDKEFQKHMAALPDEAVQEVEAAFAVRRKAFNEAQEG